MTKEKPRSWWIVLALIGAALVAGWGTAAAADALAREDIVDTAVSAGSFQTLARALEAAGLAETLKGPGPFTVFAPTDEAFAKLPKGTIESLLKPENRTKLTAILTYHVVPGRVMAAQVAAMTSAPTVNGQPLAIGAAHGTVTVGQASVVKADILCSNGVIHVIDTVLLPN
jgi:uncharacterized surface protein with fasciclin (FAS1) repeats